MKKYIIALALIISISVAVISASSKKLEEANSLTLKSESESAYILKDYKGSVALFEKDANTPKEIYALFTESLPEEDQVLLKNGIEIKDKYELQKLLEDYISQNSE